MVGQIFNTILTEPLFNILVFFYNTVAFGDFGVAIILLTALVRLLLWPLSQKALKAQQSLQELQPKIKAIQAKHKDRGEQTRALTELYKTHKVNPFGGCLPILVQLPILIALYVVFLNGLNPDYLRNLYSFVANPGAIDPGFLEVIDLSARSIPLAAAAGVFQFLQSKMALPKTKLVGAPKGSDEAIAKMISRQTLYFLPALTIIISLRLPAGLPLYWSFTTIFTILQQFAIMRRRGTRDDDNRGNRSPGALTAGIRGPN